MKKANPALADLRPEEWDYLAKNAANEQEAKLVETARNYLDITR